MTFCNYILNFQIVRSYIDGAFSAKETASRA